MNTIDAVKQILLQSGASWVLWLLGALSLVSVGIIIERWFYYRSRGANVQPLAEQPDRWLAAGGEPDSNLRAIAWDGRLARNPRRFG